MPTIVVIGTLLALKAIGLLMDPTIRLYLGDSAAYLFGALDDGRLPDDRSFTYSLILRGLVRPFESLAILGYWQSAAGVISAWALWAMLVRGFAVRPLVALIAASVLAVEPAQLYYERMVLAESFGLAAFVLFFATGSAYVTAPRVWWLPVVALLGLLSATLRLNYLPVVLCVSVALPSIAWLTVRPRAPRAWATHSMAALAATLVMHGAFIYWVGHIFAVPPGYVGRAGFMQLGLVTPLIRPEHLARVGLPADLEEELTYPLADPHARMRHMWSEGGLIRVLRARGIAIEPTARALSRMAVMDDPAGLLRLGVYTLGDYFRADGIEHALENDLGRRPIPPEILWNLRERWQYDATGLDTRTTAVSRYFEAGTPWLVACLLMLPVVSLLLVLRGWSTPWRAQAVLAAFFGVGLFAAHVLFVPVAFYRYLHPLPWFLIMSGTALLLGAVVSPGREGRLEGGGPSGRSDRSARGGGPL